MEIKESLLEYYKEIRTSLRTFDEIISKLVLQGSTVILALLTACLLSFREKYFLISFAILIGAIIITVAIFLKLTIYNNILSIGIGTAIEVERKIFGMSEDNDLKYYPSNPNKNLEYRLSENLKLNKKNKLGKFTHSILYGTIIAFFIFEFVLLGILIFGKHGSKETQDINPQDKSSITIIKK